MKIQGQLKLLIVTCLMFLNTAVCLSQGKMIVVRDSAEITADAATKIVPVLSSNFSAGRNMIASDSTSVPLRFVINGETPVSFSQSAVKQSTEPAMLGPDPAIPYFTVRFAMPIPPSYTDTDVAALTGMDSMVYVHNHSPGFEIMPNGDALAVYFSTPSGKKEADTSTSFVQARLRYGSEDWDMPELFFKTGGYNDQSAMLWNDNGMIWFFGGGRDISDMVPFRIATSVDNGANWIFSIPKLAKPATSFTAQPITSAFRGEDRSVYMAMDGVDAESYLWRSSDDGATWHDMGGRTGGRHSVIIPLDDKGKLLSIGGKNSDVDGWSPMNTSTDWGATWSKSKPSPFPPLGPRQRPSLIRLASGNLLFVSDSYLIGRKKDPPEGWEYGNDCFVAVSKDNGASWHIKVLPVQVMATGKRFPTLGYVTVRQAPNGVIHMLTTINKPCLHYEFNEAWIWSEAGDAQPETAGGTIRKFSENYPGGQVRSVWSARTSLNGRYLLHGNQVDSYEDASVWHKVKYENGRKSGYEVLYLPDGRKAWTWHRDLKNNRGIWTHYWPDGRKRIESSWNIKPEVSALKRHFYGYVADGPSRHWDEQGNLVAVYNFINGDLEGESSPETDR